MLITYTYMYFQAFSGIFQGPLLWDLQIMGDNAPPSPSPCDKTGWPMYQLEKEVI